ncbi:MAG TPA: chalcone isomerase family protein [Candidatus Sulfotelmatobacter sp.]|nr:chalcone isomerase family protein [Candidatus Sulfotelmatobacter sp.]
MESHQDKSLPKPRRLFAGMLFVLASTGILTAANLRIACAQTRASLPPAVTQKAPPVLHQVGSGSHRYFGLSVYQVTLWAANDKWNPDEPHALDLESNRAISSSQLTDAGMDEMNRLAVGTSAQRQAWRRELEQVMPSVKKGDQVVAFCAPDHKTSFFYNGVKRGEIADPAFGAAFFSIWLDPRTKNPALRRSLLNN